MIKTSNKYLSFLILIISLMNTPAPAQDNEYLSTGTKVIISGSYIEGTNTVSYHGSYMKFPEGTYTFRLAQIYEAEFMQFVDLDGNIHNSVGFGGALGFLIGPDDFPLSLLIDGRLPIGSSIGGGEPSFYIGIGSSQMLMLRLGGTVRFVAGIGGFESVLVGTTQASLVGLRMQIGIEFLE